MPRYEKPLVRHRLEYAAIVVTGRAVALLPTWLSVNLGALFGLFCYYVVPVRRKVVRENLRRAFGHEMARQELRRLEREAFKNLGMFAVDFFSIQFGANDWAKKRVVEFDGLHYLEELQNKGRCWFFVSGHFGSWEVMGAWGARDYDLAVTAKPLHNPLVHDAIARTREGQGLKVIWSGKNTMREILQCVRDGRPINMMIDQDVRNEGIFVPFLGTAASTITTPAVLALREGRPLVPAFLVRLGPTRHRLVVLPPIEPSEAEGEGKDEKVAWLMRRATGALEDIIRLHPAQYFWFHRRWRTTPGQALRWREKQDRRRRKRLAMKRE